jgi:hypothetical protein
MAHRVPFVVAELGADVEPFMCTFTPPSPSASARWYGEQKPEETTDLEILWGIKEAPRRLENRFGLQRDGSMSNPKLMLKYAVQAQRLAMQATDQDTQEAMLAYAKRFRTLAQLPMRVTTPNAHQPPQSHDRFKPPSNRYFLTKTKPGRPPTSNYVIWPSCLMSPIRLRINLLI